MMIKFSKKLSQYRYVLSFDLAKHISGYSLIDIKNNNVVVAGMIDTNQAKDCFIWVYFYNQIIDIVKRCSDLIGPDGIKQTLVIKEKLPNQNGRFSTIATLQGLAQAHSIFDLAMTHSGIDIYDYDGIHATSIKAHFKELTGIEKPQKEDVAECIKNIFPGFDFTKYSLDVTDSIAVTLTFINKKWNSDIADKIKELKKEQKGAKSANKIQRLSKEIEFLNNLKI